MLALILAASVFGLADRDKTPNACLDEISTTLERSGDSATDVAEASVYLCAIGKSRDGRPVPVDAMASIAAGAVEQVRAKVVRVRACRKTAKCDPAAIHLRDEAAAK